MSPQRFSVDDGDGTVLLGLKLPPMMVGSFALAEKFRTLFHKLRQLRLLYRPTRALCRRKVAKLRARAVDFGNWFPLNFPDSSVTPKLHWLIYHIPEIAERYGSVGQTVEQAIESLHANLNVHGRHYVCIQNDLMKISAETKNHWARASQGSVRSQSTNQKQRPSHKRRKGDATRRGSLREIRKQRTANRRSSQIYKRQVAPRKSGVLQVTASSSM